MSENSKNHCWSRKSLNIISLRKQNGKRRFKCKNCGICFIKTNSPAMSIVISFNHTFFTYKLNHYILYTFSAIFLQYQK